MPRPSGTYDLVDFGDARPPSQLLAGLGCVAHKGGGIARATLSENDGNLKTRYAPDRVDDLVDRKPPAVAEVIDLRSVAGDKRLERVYVGLRQVRHVDVIAHTRAVWGRIVCAERRRHSFVGQRPHRA
jgi:hypothetical protein